MSDRASQAALDAALRQHMTAATMRARAELGSRAAVTCVLQVLADDVLVVAYCVGLDEAGRFVQKGMGQTWSEAIEAAKHRMAEGG